MKKPCFEAPQSSLSFSLISAKEAIFGQLLVQVIHKKCANLIGAFVEELWWIL